MIRSTATLTLAAIAAVFIAGCQCAPKAADDTHAHHGHDHGHDHAKLWASVTRAIAVVHPTQGNTCAGTVTFTQVPQGVKVVAKISGLTPNQQHAFHVHEFGDSSATDGTSAGGHYNPEGHDHGLPDQAHRHAGDLGNLSADAAGNAHYEVTVDNITIAGMTNPIIGRSVIIHAKPDDGGQPVGNAGARIGCGVIGVAK